MGYIGFVMDYRLIDGFIMDHKCVKPHYGLKQWLKNWDMMGQSSITGGL
jgi:hypothetical protein